MGGRLCGNSLELFIWRSSLLCDIQIETYYTTPEMGIEGKKGAVCDLLGFGHVPSRGLWERRRKRQLYFDLTSIRTYIHTYKLYTHTTTTTTKKNIKQRPSLSLYPFLLCITFKLLFFLTLRVGFL